MKFEASFLVANGTGQNGGHKFYLAVHGEGLGFVLHGANTNNATGTYKNYTTAQATKKKVAEKRRKGYWSCDPSVISSAARAHAISKIISAFPNLNENDAVFETDGITFGAGDAQAGLPKPNSTRLQDIWF